MWPIFPPDSEVNSNMNQGCGTASIQSLLEGWSGNRGQQIIIYLEVQSSGSIAATGARWLLLSVVKEGKKGEKSWR